jgi:hypothetical protein
MRLFLANRACKISFTVFNWLSAEKHENCLVYVSMYFSVVLLYVFYSFANFLAINTIAETIAETIAIQNKQSTNNSEKLNLSGASV